MKMKRYNAEIRVEMVKDAFRAVRLHSPAVNGIIKRAEDYPIVISYHYARGMSPWELTIEEAVELLLELETAIKKAKGLRSKATQ